MFDRLPAMQALRAFEAAGRLLSMTRAAEELHLTHGAISRHIRALEEQLGVELFERVTRRIALTPAGVQFHATVTRGLGDLARGVGQVRGQPGAARLGISTGVSFASKWLAPRLHRLKAKHPEFDVHLEVTDKLVDLDAGSIDVAILYGMGHYPKARAERMLEETVTPVCSPAYLAQSGGLPTPAALMDCTLLHEVPLTANWAEWLARAGVEDVRSLRGPTFSHGSMVIEAAVRGEGVALGRSVLVAQDLAAGILVAPFRAIQLPVERGYDLVSRTGNQDHPKVQVIREWLLQEIRQDLGQPAHGQAHA
jgi:LysR family glycine cleavage system transcriptional activator